MPDVIKTRALFPAALIFFATLTAAQAQTFGTATTDLNIRSGPDPQFPVIGMIRDGRRANVLGCIEGSRWCRVDYRGQLGWAYSQYMTLSGALAAVLPAPEIEVAAPTVVARAPVVAPVIAAPAPVVAAPIAPYPAVTYQAPPVVTYQAPAPVVTYQAPAPAVAYPPAVAWQAPPAVTYPAPVPTYRAPATTTVVDTTGVRTREYAGRLIAPREIVYAATTPPRAYAPPLSVRSFIAANPLDPVYLEGNLAIGAGLPVEIGLTPVPGSRFSYAYVNDYPVLVDPASRRIVYVYR